MNVVISDTAEYGNYLFSYACVPLLKEFMTTLQTGDLGKAIAEGAVDNAQLRDVNEAIRSHLVGWRFAYPTYKTVRCRPGKA